MVHTFHRILKTLSIGEKNIAWAKLKFCPTRVVQAKVSTAAEVHLQIDRRCSLQSVNFEISFNRKRNIIRAKLNVYFDVPELSCQKSTAAKVHLQIDRHCILQLNNFECSFNRKVEHCQSKIKPLFLPIRVDLRKRSTAAEVYLQIDRHCSLQLNNFDCSFNRKVEHCQSKIKSLFLPTRVVLPKGSKASCESATAKLTGIAVCSWSILNALLTGIKKHYQSKMNVPELSWQKGQQLRGCIFKLINIAVCS